MSKSRNQSTIINNFFTLASIIIIAVTLTLYVKYIVPKQKEETKSITKNIKTIL
jgi:hypothetical protein